MAITQSIVVDTLFKKFVAQKSNTFPSNLSGGLEYFGESSLSNSYPNVFTNTIWLQSDQIPNVATSSSPVLQYVSATLSHVTGTPGAYRDASGVLVDIITFGFGTASSYGYSVFSTSGGVLGTQLNNGDNDWFLDPNSGILTFFKATTIGQTITTSGAGTISPSNPPVVRAWKYIGKKGVIPNLSGLTYSAGTMSLVIGTGLTFSGGALVATTQNPSVGLGLTSQGVTFSVLLNTNSGLTVSNSGLSVNIGSGLTISSGLLSTTTNVVAGSGLTASGNTFSVQLQSSSGLTVSNSGLSLNIGSGLTVSSGLLSTTVNVVAGWGLTSSGNTFSVQLQNNSGLTVSNIGLSVNIGSGLTVSSGLLSTTTTNVVAGSGLTASGNTFSVQLQNNSGLTVSNSGLSVNIGSGLTVSSGLLSTTNTPIASSGLTSNGNTFSVQLQSSSGLTISSLGIAVSSSIAGAGLSFSGGVLSTTGISFNVGNGLVNSGGGTLSVLLDNTSSLTFSGVNLTIGSRIAGTGLTLSSGILVNTAIPVAGSGLTSVGNTFSVNGTIAGNGLTFSNGVLNLSTGVNSSATNSIAFYSGSGTISGTLSVSSLFLQNGNSFGTVAVLGTNDNNNLQFETNGVVRMQIGTSGNVTIGTFSDYGSKVQISGLNVLQLIGSTDSFAGTGIGGTTSFGYEGGKDASKISFINTFYGGRNELAYIKSSSDAFGDGTYQQNTNFTYSLNTGNLVFGVGISSSTATEKLRIGTNLINIPTGVNLSMNIANSGLPWVGNRTATASAFPIITLGHSLSTRPAMWITDNIANAVPSNGGLVITTLNTDKVTAVSATLGTTVVGSLINPSTMKGSVSPGRLVSSVYYGAGGQFGFASRRTSTNRNPTLNFGQFNNSDEYGFFSQLYTEGGSLTYSVNAFSSTLLYDQTANVNIATSSTRINLIDFRSAEVSFDPLSTYTFSQNLNLNRYGFLIDFAASTTTGSNPVSGNISTFSSVNSWGIYQSSTSLRNYFGGPVLIGTTVSNGNNLQVRGTVSIIGNLNLASASIIDVNGSTGVSGWVLSATANGVIWSPASTTLSTLAVSGSASISGNLNIDGTASWGSGNSSIQIDNSSIVMNYPGVTGGGVTTITTGYNLWPQGSNISSPFIIGTISISPYFTTSIELTVYADSYNSGVLSKTQSHAYCITKMAAAMVRPYDSSNPSVEYNIFGFATQSIYQFRYDPFSAGFPVGASAYLVANTASVTLYHTVVPSSTNSYRFRYELKTTKINLGQ